VRAAFLRWNRKQRRYFFVTRFRAGFFAAGLRACDTFLPTTRFRAAGFVAGFRATLVRFFAGDAFLPRTGLRAAGFRVFFATGFLTADFRAAPGRFLAAGFRAFTDLRAVFFAGISLPPSG